MRGQTTTGIAAIALGVGFNVPYAILASLYDYPQILRRPAAEALHRFADGGAPLILTWYAFMLAALALVPVAMALSLTPSRLARSPALAVGAAVTGALAGLAQAIGLARWVFVVPALAREADTAAAQSTFDMLNAYGGVAIGENLGQLLTAAFVFQVAALQRRDGAVRLAWLAGLSAVTIAAGTGEGLALALERDGGAFSFATIAGFLGLSLWLIATGAMLARRGAGGTA
jgi:hypothetical protein